jgi:hypothetical protein
MKQRPNLPVEGKQIRFAPSRNRQEPDATLWKVWAEGSEVYACARGPGGSAHISVHQSGQVHFRQGAKQKQDMAPVMQLGNGPWFHAFELRFLLSQGAYLPFKQRESLKNKSAYLMWVPDGFVLYANLIIGSTGTALDCSLPEQLLPAGQTLWRTRLRDGRPAVLVGRLLPLDDQSRERIKYVREELKPSVTFSTMPSTKYVEIYSLHWSPEGGNVVCVVPMGNEAFRSEDEDLQLDTLPPTSRYFRYQSIPSAVELTAPNGLAVAVIELAAIDKEIELVKGTPKTIELELLTMRIKPSNLIAGSPFVAPPRRLVYSPTVGGASPRDWGHIIHARFDGSCLSAEIGRTSTALQNKNLLTPISELDSGEEIVMAIPTESVKISAVLDLPATSTALLGRFTLRDRR